MNGQMNLETGKASRITEKWRREVQHNRLKMEFYRAILRSGFGKMTKSKLENACFLFAKLEKLKQRNRKLYRAILEFQNGERIKNNDIREFAAL